ncbi:MAG: signal peptidase I [Ruminococcus sp.]|uniref:signal peptidase I n=1 Tax=Ruminococcus sp. TaxID=41978 RepID=UPI0025FCDC88|nr:signal peptidase I [Ruminococcus sp.]MCR5539990.1 signal peptidase I [Ruminococcus sp.]
MSEPNEKTTNGNIGGADDDLERLLNETDPNVTGDLGADESGENFHVFGTTDEDLTEDAAELEQILNEQFPDGVGSVHVVTPGDDDGPINVEAIVNRGETVAVTAEDIKRVTEASKAVEEDIKEVSEKAEVSEDDTEDSSEVAEVSEEDIEKAKEAEPEDIKEKEPFNIGREILEWFESLVFALLIVQLVLTFLLRIVMVDGESMTNTLQNGDRLIMTHVAYEPERDDIVVLDSEAANKVLIKRVIGIEGDKVVVDYNQNHVYVNDEEISNEHIREVMLDSFYFDPQYSVDAGVYEYEVPKDTVFVMGDNRNDSKDSRSIGFIPKSEIMGKAIFRVYPFKSLGRVD